MLVPKATNTIAVTESSIPNVAPKCDAASPMTAVTNPIPNMETTKQQYPFAMPRKEYFNYIILKKKLIIIQLRYKLKNKIKQC